MHLTRALSVLALALIPRLVAAQFPTPHDTQKTDTRPLPAAEAAARWKFPEGFQVSVFAAEPEVRQPIAMAIDDRGRLWVAENYTYAEARKGFEADLRDRLVIFEDQNGDGRFDRRTVFADNLEHLTSVELGFGGVWALTSPTLVFIPDRDRDDRPDGPAEVKLDGFDWKRNHHTLANGLRWGPDGWLYGRHGIQAVSEIAPPGAPAEKRARTNGGIWRYHPRRQAVEVVCHGTTNPWGMDWNEHGEPFFINTVIGHLWHVIPGAHYRRMHGVDLIPNVYEVLEQTADHVHWAVDKESWSSWRNTGTTAASSAAGGGHAHTGLLFYHGDNWPAAWKGRLLTINFNGRRLNVDDVTRTAGSGYVGRHRPDIGVSADAWFRGIDLISGADGGVYIADWSDTGECHDDDGVFRNSGRIYKVTHGQVKAPAFGDIGALGAAELLPLLDHPNEFYGRHARRRLQEAAATGADLGSVADRLFKKFQAAEDTVERLRALWSLHAIGRADSTWLRAQLGSRDEHLRAWAVRLLVDDPAALATEPASLAALADRAAVEPSAFVRLALASALQRMPLDRRAPVARSLLRRAEDASDPALPQMLWYGIEPLAAGSPGVLAELGATCELPLTRRCISRRLAQEPPPGPHAAALARLLSHAAKEPRWQPDVLAGLAEALRGQRDLPAPQGWKEAAPAFEASLDPGVGRMFRALGVIFRDPLAIDALRQAVRDADVATEVRRSALQSLISSRDERLGELCEGVLTTPGLSGAAAEGLALNADPANADRILGRFREIAPAERSAVLATVLSRATWAARALDALAGGTLARSEVSPFHARQIRGFDDDALTKRLADVWGASRDTGAEQLQRIAEWKKRLPAEALRGADKNRGRVVYQNICGTCHVLNGAGGKIGPDLTGSARDNLDYLLQNIVDPSAAVANEYRLVTLEMKDGRSLSGYVRSRENLTVLLQTLGETLTLPAGDIEETRGSTLSLMPDGLLETLPEADVRALIAYLMQK